MTTPATAKPSAAKPAAAKVAAAKPAAAKPAAAKPAAAKPAAKPKAVPAKAAKAAIAAEIKAAEVEVAAVDAEADVEGDEDAPTKKSRIQLAAVLNINISQARCATHLKQYLGAEDVEAEIKELRRELKDEKEAGNAPRIEELKKTIAAKSKVLVRISSETPIAAAVVLDNMIKELIRHGMSRAAAGDRKIVDVAHLHDGNPEALEHWPLFNKCPSWSNYNPGHEDDLKKERAVTNKAAKEAREARKAAANGEKLPKGARAGAKAAKAAAEAEEAEDDDEQHTKTTFYTYVESALKMVKKDETFKSMRVSNRVREYLSDMVAECIARLATLARKIVQGVIGVRTMNADHVKAIIDLLMTDDGRSEEDIAKIIAQIDEKLAVYQGHLKSEKDKKALSLDEDKKVELEDKKMEADLIRKKKQIETAKKRATEAAKRAKELTLETVALEPIVAAHKAAAAEAAAATEAAAAEAVVAEAAPAEAAPAEAVAEETA